MGDTTFQKRILAERYRLDLSQDDMAEILQHSKRTIYNWETEARSQMEPHILVQEAALARLRPLDSTTARRVAAKMRAIRLAKEKKNTT